MADAPPPERELADAEVVRVRRMEERMELLLAVTGELAGAQTHDDVARITIHKGVAALGGSYGGLWMLEPEARMLRLAAVSSLPRGSAERWTVLPLDTDAPLPHVARTGEPLYIATLAQFQAQFPASFERMRETVSSADASYILLPVMAKGKIHGALAITYERANAVDDGERTYLSLVARQCALALERIQLYNAERDARIEAEDATRAREEILSVVSHDLRNPLGTILMGATSVLSLADASDPKGQRMRTAAERIQRQAERMARLIEDLVDFAGIQAGKLSIERRPTAPAAILVAVNELFTPFAQEREIGFEIDAPAELPLVDCDLDRALQLFSNLAGNAIKVTPRGGRITIGATAGAAEVVFFVRDTGPGIEAEELPRLFERYWRSKKAPYKGAGLGLSIARGIVDAHGGRIWAESQVGVCTSFFFTLTPRPDPR